MLKSPSNTMTWIFHNNFMAWEGIKKTRCGKQNNISTYVLFLRSETVNGSLLGLSQGFAFLRLNVWDPPTKGESSFTPCINITLIRASKHWRLATNISEMDRNGILYPSPGQEYKVTSRRPHSPTSLAISILLCRLSQFGESIGVRSAIN